MRGLSSSLKKSGTKNKQTNEPKAWYNSMVKIFCSIT